MISSSTHKSRRVMIGSLTVIAALCAALAFGVGTAAAAFSFKSSTIGIGSVQTSNITAATKIEADTKLDLPSEGMTADSVAALAVPTERVAHDLDAEAAEPAPVVAEPKAEKKDSTDTTAKNTEEAAEEEEAEEVTAASSASYGSTCVATWYDDGGSSETAAGYSCYYGIAHRSLPFGTQVQITYGGNTIVATVDDRGPFGGGAEIDLNQNCAAALGMMDAGRVRVYYTVL